MKTNKSVAILHKQLAVDCFNKVWDILDINDRTESEAEEMVHLCHSSFWNWTQVEDHTQQNLSIGYWQLSRVYSEVGNGEQALHYAKRCLTISNEAELAPFYVSYAYEALARAHSILKQTEQVEKNLTLANKFRYLVEDVESKKLLEVDLENIKR